MPLLALKTNLKDIKFGRDRLGNGDSGEPFIRFPYPEIADEKFKRWYLNNATNLDFPIRGGEVSLDTTPASLTLEIDRERISKFLKTTARGKIFIQKQIGLQLSNPRMQTAETVPSFKIGDLPGLIENTRLYNQGRNTLTQVQVMGTGYHLNRAGAVPFNPIEKFYKDVVGLEKLITSPEELSRTNRLLILQQMKLKPFNYNGEDSNTVALYNNKLGVSNYNNLLFQYLGGPGSTYGIGNTTVKRYDFTERATQNTKSSDGIPMSKLAMSYDLLMRQRSTTSKNGVRDNYGDFRNSFFPKYGGVTGSVQWGGNRLPKIPTDPTNPIGGLIENSLTITQNLTDTKNRIDYRLFSSKEGERRVDKMNTLSYIYTEDGNYTTDDSADDDLIKLCFECLSNDNTIASTFLFFRAYLGNITDNNQGAYNGFRYMGRGENFYTYQGFERSISFGFKIAIGSKKEIAPTYEKLNYLISQVYPDYAPQTNYMRGNLIRLTIGDYISSMPGFLDSVNITVNTDTSWEIDDMQQLPHVLDVSITFKPIFDDLPRRSMGLYTNTPIIAQRMISTLTQNRQDTDKLKSGTSQQIKFTSTQNTDGIPSDELPNFEDENGQVVAVNTTNSSLPGSNIG